MRPTIVECARRQDTSLVRSGPHLCHLAGNLGYLALDTVLYGTVRESGAGRGTRI